MAKAMTGKQKKKKEVAPIEESHEPIVIDKGKNLIFNTEEEVYKHFNDEIAVLEHEFANLRNENDIAEESIEDFEAMLSELFERPDEVWKDTERFENVPIYTYIKKFDTEDGQTLHYIALTYIDDHIPTFIFLHFPTQDETMLDAYRRTEKVYSSEQSRGEADALSEGDELAVGLYKAMLTVRSKDDIPEENFGDYLQYRDETVENADEIWRNSDLQGNVLVSFIKEVHLEEEEFTYIVVTKEDNFSESHYLLFSFPTTDKTLADRYRHGETLHTEQVVQEESH